MAFQTVNLYITTLTGQGFWAAHKLLTGQIIYAIAAGPDFFSQQFPFTPFFNIIEWHLLPLLYCRRQ